MSQDKFLMDNQNVLVSASRYLSVVYDIDLFTGDDHVALKFKSYVKLLNDDDVLAEYWAMYKETYQQEKVAATQVAPIVDDFSLWDNTMSSVVEETTMNTVNVDHRVNASEQDVINQDVINIVDDIRIVLPRGL